MKFASNFGQLDESKIRKPLITALSLLDRPNTHFIGESTAGYMTSNELIRLPFEVFLLPANARETDRHGNVVSVIVPDRKIVEGDNFGNLRADRKVSAAIDWIKNRTE